MHGAISRSLWNFSFGSFSAKSATAIVLFLKVTSNSHSFFYVNQRKWNVTYCTAAFQSIFLAKQTGTDKLIGLHVIKLSFLTTILHMGEYKELYLYHQFSKPTIKISIDQFASTITVANHSVFIFITARLFHVGQLHSM